MLKLFRRYKVKIQWIPERSMKVEHGTTVFNLLDVKCWTTCINEQEGFNDNINRTIVEFYDRTSNICVVPFSEFDEIMSQFHKDYKMMDDDSSPVEPPKRSAKYTYRGMMEVSLKEDEKTKSVAVAFFPEGQTPKSFDEAVLKCLFSNTTPMN